MASRKGRRYLSAAQREMLDVLSLLGNLPVPTGWRELRSLASLERQGLVRIQRNPSGAVVNIVAADDPPKLVADITASDRDKAIAAKAGITVEQMMEARKFYKMIS